MKEIVERILKEELVASKALEQAKIEAENIIAAAKKEAEALIKETIIKTKEIIDAQKSEAEKKFISEKEKVIQDTLIELAFLRQKKEKDTPEISKKIFYRIIGIKA